MWLRALSLDVEDDENELLLAMRGHTEVINRCLLANDNIHAFSCGNDHLIKVWDLKNGECVGTLQGHTGHVTAIAVSNNPYLICSGGGEGDQACRLWDIRSGVCIQHWDCGTARSP